MVKNIDSKGGDCMADNQNRKERMKSYVEQIKNPYLFKVGNTVVRVSYANTQATINDNFVNLLASM